MSLGRNTVDSEQTPDPLSKSEFDAIVDKLYPQLRALAAKVRWRGPEMTQPTALLHDAYIKLRTSELADPLPSNNILGLFADVLRQVMIDGARRTKSAKRGGGVPKVRLGQEGEHPIDIPSPDHGLSREEILTMEAALRELREVDPRKADIVDLRYFLGLTAQETARILGIALTSVEREWREARAFLGARIDPEKKRA